MIGITGIGIVDSFGNNIDSNFQKLLQGVCTISPIKNYDVDKYPIISVKHAHQLDADNLVFEDLLTNNERKQLDRFIVSGLYAAKDAIEESKINSSNVGIIYSSLGAGTETLHQIHVNVENNKKSHIKKMLSCSRDYLSNIISQKFNFQGVNLCITSACSSGIVALDYACKLLESGVHDYMIVGAADLPVDVFYMYNFNSIGAMDNTADPKTRPFNKVRNGLTMGEGACCFVLEKIDNARDKKIYGIIRGIGLANEAHHDTSMTLDAKGARKTIEEALAKSNLNPNDIDIINCHATGTGNGDLAEYNVLSALFQNKPVTALKANLGHTMGACSLIEIAYGLKCLESQLLPPVINLDEPIGEDIYFAKKAENLDCKYMLKNSFGFGGKCGSIIIERG